MKVLTYALDVILTAYYGYGLYGLLFTSHTCNEDWTLNYVNMIVLLIIVSPKVAVYLVALTTIIMFFPCILVLVISYIRNPALFYDTDYQRVNEE
jgi:hypothetical protein